MMTLQQKINMAITFAACVPGGRYTLAILLCAAGLAGSMHAHAAMTLQVRVTTHAEAGPNGSKAPPDNTEEKQVVIGARYMSVTSRDRADIYDFARRRRFAVDLRAARYIDYSLFDTVGFRVMEMQNRQAIGHAFAAAKIAAPAIDAVDNEQALSILAGSGERLDQAADGADQVFSIIGKPLLRRSAAGTPVSPDDAAGFVQFLRYTAGGHPLVLDQLAASRTIPKQLTLSYREAGGSQTRRVEVLTMTPSAPASYDLTRYTEGSAATGDIDRLLDQIQASKPPARDDSRTAMQEQAARAFAEQRPLDALLGGAELMLMTGVPMAPFTPGQKAQLQGDPLVRQLSAAMAASGKAGLTAAIPVLQQLQKAALEKRYMLTLFEANDHAGLGQADVARPMFISVLNGHPWLAGAYRDLGDVQFRQFDMARAWRCWDAGRRMAPELGLFATVNQHETNLVQQHPEYF